MIFLLTIWAFFAVSVQDTIPPETVRPDTIPEASVQDTIPPAVPDSLDSENLWENREQEQEEEILLDTLKVWKYSYPESMAVGETDSTMRWVNLLNLFDRFHDRKGAITARMGTVGRLDGLSYHTYESRHLNLEMEGLDMNDPLTNSVNWNRLPIHKIKRFAESDYGSSYRSEVRLRDHYLVEPRTYLNFDESKYNYRSLEFSFTQNFTQKTNFELSFWDRRDGGGYSRSGVEGRQIVLKAYHQLTDRWLLKAGYINNVMDLQESFGYSIPGDNPQFFTFNPFVEIPNQSSANSNQSSNDIYLQAHHRRNDSSNVSTEFGLHYQKTKWDLSYTADTLATSIRNIEMYARQYIKLGSGTLRVTGRGFLLNEQENRNISNDQWMGLKGDLDLHQPLTGWSSLSGFVNIAAWDDTRQSTEFSGKLEVRPFNGATMSVFAGLKSGAPDIQSRYWQSNEFAGSSETENEESVTAGGMLQVNLGKYFSVGARGDIRETENAIFADRSAGSLRSIDPYTQISSTGWIGFNSKVIEAEVSGTYKQFSSSSPDSINVLLNNSGNRVWIKSHMYWKNYLFDRATFVKAGLSGVFSPFAFRTAEYYPQLNRWQHGTNEYINPSYYRLDADISARIRWFMIVIKWENILDRVGQAGYFESTGYPMPERRFTLGIRVLFTN
ncbi:MAG: putative porin [Balneolaceae bacterium]